MNDASTMRVVIPQKYETVLREINIEIEKFNLPLAEEFRIAPLDTSSKSWFLTVDVPYAKISHPYNHLPGVYILCACCQSDPLCVGAYIGKSSGARVAMGWRLDTHFRPGKATNTYTMANPRGVPYMIEAISAIGLPERMRTFAPALGPVNTN